MYFWSWELEASIFESEVMAKMESKFAYVKRSAPIWKTHFSLERL